MAINRDKVLEAAQKFVEKKKYDKAVAELRKLVEADPNDARTLLKIGDLQAKQGIYPDAINTYESVGKLYASQGFALKAIAVYKQIREIIAKHVPQLEERYGHIAPKLAELYQQLGLTSDALAALDEVATRLQRQQRDQEAIEVFRRIVELDPTNPLPHLRLAEALSRVKDTDGAVFEFKTAAQQLAGIGRRDDALKVLERLLHHKQDPEQAKLCAELYLARAQPQDGMQALSKLQVCFQANPRDFDTLSLLARAFNAIGQGAKAIEVQKEMARVARDTGKMDLFREILERLNRVAPHDEGVRRLAQQTGSVQAPAYASQAPSEPPEPVPTEPRREVDPPRFQQPPMPREYSAEGYPEEPAAVYGQPSSRVHPAPPQQQPPQAYGYGAPMRGGPPPLTARQSPAAPEPDPEEEEIATYDDDVEELVEEVVEEEAEVSYSESIDTDDAYAEQGTEEDLGGYDEPEPEPEPEPPYAPPAYAPSAYAPPAYAPPAYDAPKYAPEYAPGYPQEPSAYGQTGESSAQGYVPDAGEYEPAPHPFSHGGYDDHGDLPPASAVDAVELVNKALADASAFRRVRLYAKALETLRAGLDVEPRSMDLHEVYRDVLIEAGQTEDAVDEMLVIASLYVDALDGDSAARALQDVLAFDPQNQRAIEMLQELGYEIVDENEAGAEVDPHGAPDPYAEPVHDDRLPSYDLEEMRPADVSSQYTDERQIHRGSNPPRYADIHDEPDLDPITGESLPAFPLDEPSHDAYADADADIPSVRPLHPSRRPISVHPESAAELRVSHSPAFGRIPQGPRAASQRPASLAPAAKVELEDALDEAEFFCSRGLFDDARAILSEQVSRHPNHPLLVERLAEIEAQENQRGSGAREKPREAENNASSAFAMSQSLDALESLDYDNIEPAEGHAGEEQQVDVEEVFAKFKEGVAKQISVDDSDSHYNLGIAYKEMSLLDDAIREFDVAAMDPNRECVCRSMIGMIQLERGHVNEAIDAFLQGLNASIKEPQQETVLCFEIGAAYEAKKMNKDALTYFQKAMRRDPNYRDVQERVRRLAKAEPKQNIRQAAVGADDEFDRAFDDLLSKA